MNPLSLLPLIELGLDYWSAMQKGIKIARLKRLPHYNRIKLEKLERKYDRDARELGLKDDMTASEIADVFRNKAIVITDGLSLNDEKVGAAINRVADTIANCISSNMTVANSIKTLGGLISDVSAATKQQVWGSLLRLIGKAVESRTEEMDELCDEIAMADGTDTGSVKQAFDDLMK